MKSKADATTSSIAENNASNGAAESTARTVAIDTQLLAMYRKCRKDKPSIAQAESCQTSPRAIVITKRNSGQFLRDKCGDCVATDTGKHVVRFCLGIPFCAKCGAR